MTRSVARVWVVLRVTTSVTGLPATTSTDLGTNPSSVTVIATRDPPDPPAPPARDPVPHPATSTTAATYIQTEVFNFILLRGRTRPEPALPLQLSIAPIRVDDRDDLEGQEGRGQEPPHHGRGHPLHHVGPGPLRPEQGDQADHHGGDRHQFGPHALDRALQGGVHDVVQVADPPLGLALVRRGIAIHHHHDSGLSREPHHRDHPHPHRGRR